MTDPDAKIRNKSTRSHPLIEKIAVEIRAKISGVNNFKIVVDPHIRLMALM